jgi:hypothetical protein
MPLEVWQGTGANAVRIEPQNNIYYVYINELPAGVTDSIWGRTITVRPQGSSDPIPVPPSTSCTAGIPTGEWTLTPDSNNTAPAFLDQSLRIEIPATQGNPDRPTPGQRVTLSGRCRLQFFSSSSGLDRYEVTFSGETVIIEVWRRISYIYKEMQRLDDPSRTFRLTISFRGSTILESAIAYFQRLGIELSGSTTPQASHLANAVLDGSGIQSALGFPSTIPENLRRELRICAAGELTLSGDQVVGLGGGNIAAVACQTIANHLTRYNDLQADYQRFLNRRYSNSTLEDQWLNRLSPTPGPRAREFYRSLISIQGGHISTEEIVKNELFTTLVHEIGHALGLVPASGQAGGFTYPQWHDNTGHSNHCRNENCAMWWEVDLGELILSRVPRGDPPPPFCAFQTTDTRCEHHLYTCDLSDIRDLPS